MVFYFCRFVCFLLSKIFFRTSVFGRGNIPKSGGFILASNHVSFLDPVLLGVSCPRKVNFMARHTLFKAPVFSWLLPMLNTFPVKRDYADISALKEAIRRLKNNGPLVMFPEGTRGAGGVLGRPEPGIGLLVKKAGVPVVPAFIKGSAEAWGRQTKFIRPVKIRVFFGKQISMERGLSREAIAEEVMRQISYLQSHLCEAV